MWLIALISVILGIVYLLGFKPFKHWANRGIPHITPRPFFGNVAANVLQRKSFADLLIDFSHEFPNNRYFGIYNFMQPALVVKDPELIKQITVKEFDVFPEHRAFVPDGVDPLWSKNLVAIKGGQKWHDMRSTLSPSFTSSKMRMMFTLMKGCSKQFVQHYKRETGIATVEMKDAFTRFANDVIATTAFGIDCDSLANPNNEFYLMGKDATNFRGIKALRFFISAVNPTLMKILKIGIFSKAVSKFFRDLIKQTISVREKFGVVRPDMVHLLMEARKGRFKNDDVNSNVTDSGFAVVDESTAIKSNLKPEKQELTDEDITAQALIFFIAGFETAATFMCFTAYELAVNPDVQDRLRKEIDEAYENTKDGITYETLLSMKYLDMVVTESLRKWPPATALDRMSVKPYTIEPKLPGEKRITLEAGTNVWIPTYSIQRDPINYPEPETFDPERFSDENKHNIKPFTYSPFGLGPRNCIGSRFALLEGKLVIAEIIRNFEIVPVEKTPIPMTLDTSSFSPYAKNGFWLGFKPRSPLKFC